MMKTIKFKVALCGMSEKSYSDKIKLGYPMETEEISFTLDECVSNNIYYISELIEWVKKSLPELIVLIGQWGMDRFNFKNICIENNERLIGFRCDKLLEDLFDFFCTDHVELVYVVIPGGASVYCAGYKYVVHSDEYVHQYDRPHVHVIKDDVSVRYYLDTLERYQQDTPSREHLRDEKKVIIPTIVKNRKKLLEYWNQAVNGFIPPAENAAGEQYYD